MSDLRPYGFSIHASPCFSCSNMPIAQNRRLVECRSIGEHVVHIPHVGGVPHQRLVEGLSSMEGVASNSVGQDTSV